MSIPSDPRAGPRGHVLLFLSRRPRDQAWSTEAVASVNTLCVKWCVRVGGEPIAFI